MKFELIEINNVENISANCFPDFFDDCNPTESGCIPSEMDDETI